MCSNEIWYTSEKWERILQREEFKGGKICARIGGIFSEDEEEDFVIIFKYGVLIFLKD